MLMITELLTPTPGPLWRWPEPGQEDGPPPFEAPPQGERAWDRRALARLQAAYREYGLELAVIEDTAPMDAVRLAPRAATSRSPGCTTRSGRWASSASARSATTGTR
jgi:hypothetical protein